MELTQRETETGPEGSRESEREEEEEEERERPPGREDGGKK